MRRVAGGHGISNPRPRLWCCLVLAIGRYLVTALCGEGRIGCAVFLAGGVIAELAYWRHLLQRIALWWQSWRGVRPNT